MSVYTSVSEPELAAWLVRFDVGGLHALAPIASGIENSNYFVTTDSGEFVLTLYERIPAEDLPFYLNLVAHLAKSGVKVAKPIADRSGALFSMLNGKPASLVTRLRGASIESPTPEHCAHVGAEMARLHLASSKFRSRLSNSRGAGWMLSTSRAVRSFLSEDQNALLAQELAAQKQAQTGYADKLPHGAIHADLFRDNALFDGDALSGFIDFGFAATDAYIYDLAITANDWCINDDLTLDVARTQALIDAYHRERPLSSNEQSAWAMMLRLGALRFWLSRLYDLHLPRSGELVFAKDPAHFERMLRARIAQPPMMAL